MFGGAAVARNNQSVKKPPWYFLIIDRFGGYLGFPQSPSEKCV